MISKIVVFAILLTTASAKASLVADCWERFYNSQPKPTDVRLQLHKNFNSLNLLTRFGSTPVKYIPGKNYRFVAKGIDLQIDPHRGDGPSGGVGAPGLHDSVLTIPGKKFLLWCKLND